MKSTYLIILVLGIAIGAVGMQTYLHSPSTDNDRFGIGDYVKTNNEWNEWYTPVCGNVTDIDHYEGNTLVVIDGNQSRWINEDWFVETELK
jgi:hypothetical protein